MTRRSVSIASALVIVIVIAVTGLGDMQRILDFFFGTRDRSELVTKELKWVDRSGQTRIALFKIPYGYLSQTTVESPGQAIDLEVIYPAGASEGSVVGVPNNPNRVTITISSANQALGVVTTGDRLKMALDKDSLPPHLFIADTRAEVMVLEEKSRSNAHDSRKEYLFQDQQRGHWIYSRALQLTHRQAIGVTSDQVAFVSYLHRETAENDAKAMHSWVMAFVERLQQHTQPSTASSPRTP